MCLWPDSAGENVNYLLMLNLKKNYETYNTEPKEQVFASNSKFQIKDSYSKSKIESNKEQKSYSEYQM